MNQLTQGSLRSLVVLIGLGLGLGLGLMAPLAPQSRAETIRENFSADPAASGWIAVGETNLFRGKPENKWLEVSWDSSKAQSLFLLPLPRPLTSADGFSFGFNLNLWTNHAGPFFGPAESMPVTIGLFNLRDTTNRSLLTPGTISNMVVLHHTTIDLPANPHFFGFRSALGFADDKGIATPPPGHLTVVTPRLQPSAGVSGYLLYDSETRSIRHLASYAGQQGYSPITYLPQPATSFSCDAFGVIVWNQASWNREPANFEGTLSGVRIGRYSHPIGPLTMPTAYSVAFVGQPAWEYSLDASSDLSAWTPVQTIPGDEGELRLSDSREGLFSQQFYRVRAKIWWPTE